MSQNRVRSFIEEGKPCRHGVGFQKWWSPSDTHNLLNITTPEVGEKGDADPEEGERKRRLRGQGTGFVEASSRQTASSAALLNK